MVQEWQINSPIGTPPAPQSPQSAPPSPTILASSPPIPGLGVPVGAPPTASPQVGLASFSQMLPTQAQQQYIPMQMGYMHPQMMYPPWYPPPGSVAPGAQIMVPQMPQNYGVPVMPMGGWHQMQAPMHYPMMAPYPQAVSQALPEKFGVSQTPTTTSVSSPSSSAPHTPVDPATNDDIMSTDERSNSSSPSRKAVPSRPGRATKANQTSSRQTTAPYPQTRKSPTSAASTSVSVAVAQTSAPNSASPFKEESRNASSSSIIKLGPGFTPVRTNSDPVAVTVLCEGRDQLSAYLEQEISIGDVPIDINEVEFTSTPIEFSNSAAPGSNDEQVATKLKINEETLSYALHAAYWKNASTSNPAPTSSQLQVKMNGECVAKLNIEWEQELLDHMDDWIRDMGHQGKQRAVLRHKQQDRNEQALLSEISQLWQNYELDPDARRMINYFVTVALNDLEFHRKRDSYAMFITRLDAYAHQLQTYGPSNRVVRRAFHELWIVISAETQLAYHLGYKKLLSTFTRTRKFDLPLFEKLGQLLHLFCAQHWASFNILVTLGACVPTVHERGARRQIKRLHKELLEYESPFGTEHQQQQNLLAAGTAAGPGSETLVFFFATDKYRHSLEIPETKSCASDAKRLYTLLTEKTHNCRAHTTFNRNFTKESFDEFIHQLPVMLKPGLQILICIHSHAMREGSDTFVCPWDCDPSHLSRTGISLNHLRDRLRELLHSSRDAKGVHIALYLDTCHSGLTDDRIGADATAHSLWPSSNNVSSNGPDDHVSDSLSVEENARQSSFEQIGASGSNQKALEKEPYGSYLTYAFASFLDGLSCDAGFFEAFKHMKTFVAGKTGESQVPVYSRFTSGDGQFRFVARNSAREQRLLRLVWPPTNRIWQLGVPFAGEHYKMFFALFSETMEGSKTINRNVKATIMRQLHLDDERDLEYAYKQIQLPSGRVPDKIDQYGDITTFIDSATSLIHIRAPESYRVFLLKVQADLSCHDSMELQKVKCIRYSTSQLFSAPKSPPQLEKALALVDGQFRGRLKQCVFAWCARSATNGSSHSNSAFSSPSVSPRGSSTSESKSSRGPTSSAPSSPVTGSSTSSKRKIHHHNSSVLTSSHRSMDDSDDQAVPFFECIDLKRMLKADAELIEYRYEDAVDVAFLKSHAIVAINTVRAEQPYCLLFKLSWTRDGRVERQLFKKIPAAVQKVTYGQLHICCLTRGGDIYCFGTNNEHQLGAKNPNPAKILKSHILSAEKLLGGSLDANNNHPTFVDICSGEIHNLALTSDGRVWSWGGNASGQLGRKKTEDAREISDLNAVRHISCGSFSSAATTACGAPKVWGFCKAEGLLRQQHVPRTLALPLKKGISVGSVLLGTTSALIIEREGKPQFIDSKEKEEALELDSFNPNWKLEKKNGVVSWRAKLSVRNKYPKSDVAFAFVARLTNAVLHVETKTATKTGRHFQLPPGEKHRFKLVIVPIPSDTEENAFVSGSIVINIRGSLAYSISVPERHITCDDARLSVDVVEQYSNILSVDQIGFDEVDMIHTLRNSKFPHLNVLGFLQTQSNAQVAYCVREKLRPLLEVSEPGAGLYKKVKTLIKVGNMIKELLSRQICCRDLAVENLLVNNFDQPIVQSLKNTVTSGRKDKMTIDPKLLSSNLRTLPPETFTSKKASGAESMIFSFGILIYEVLSGRKVARSKANLQEGIVPFDDDDPRAQTWAFRYLYRSCCSPSKDRRPALPNVVAALEYHLNTLKQEFKNLNDPLVHRRSRRAAAVTIAQKKGRSTASADSNSKSSSSTERSSTSSTTQQRASSTNLIAAAASRRIAAAASAGATSSSSAAATGDTSPMDATEIISASESSTGNTITTPVADRQPDELVDSVTESARRQANSVFFAGMELHTIGPINYNSYLEEVKKADISWGFQQRIDHVEIMREIDSDSAAPITPLVTAPTARELLLKSPNITLVEAPAASLSPAAEQECKSEPDQALLEEPPVPDPAPANSKTTSNSGSKKQKRSSKFKIRNATELLGSSASTTSAVDCEGSNKNNSAVASSKKNSLDVKKSASVNSASGNSASRKSTKLRPSSSNEQLNVGPTLLVPATARPGNEISGEEDDGDADMAPSSTILPVVPAITIDGDHTEDSSEEQTHHVLDSSSTVASSSCESDNDEEFDPDEAISHLQAQQQQRNQQLQPKHLGFSHMAASTPPMIPGQGNVVYMYMPVPVYAVMDAHGQQRFVPMHPSMQMPMPLSMPMPMPTQAGQKVQPPL